MLQLDVAGRPPGRGAKCCRPTLARLHGRIRNGASSGVPCARLLACSLARTHGCCPGVARTGGRGREKGRPAVGRADHGCPRPAAARLHAASRRAPRAKRMNQPRPPFPVLSLKSAGGRAQRRSMLAFREHSPSRPSRPRGLSGSPPRLLTKGFRIAVGCPCRPPCHHHLDAALPPEAAGAVALKRSREGGAAVRARVCGASVGLVCTRAEENPAWSARRPLPGVLVGLRRGWPAPSAQARAANRARTCPAGTPGRCPEESLGPLSQCSLPGLGVRGECKIWLKLAHGFNYLRSILERDSLGMLPKPQAIGNLAKSNSSGLLTSTVLMNTMSRTRDNSPLPHAVGESAEFGRPTVLPMTWHDIRDDDPEDDERDDEDVR
ncbi:hypothetical protein LEMLEM_LOCUS6881 [Lemmus lemmus]